MKTKIYSRNSEDNTGKYPDIAGLFPRLLQPGVSSVVFDAEAVAYDRTTGKILPFQVLSTRSRKDVKVDSIKVQVCLYVFDCLFKDGKALLQEPLTARREAMRAAVKEEAGFLEFAEAKVRGVVWGFCHYVCLLLESVAAFFFFLYFSNSQPPSLLPCINQTKTQTSNDLEELGRFLDESVEAGTEGLIVKTLADSYEPSKRSMHWLKLKKDYLEGVGDTFDLVPIGAWFGRGKRTGVFGSYLLAIYNPDTEEYQSITKIGTGFSEELLKQMAEQMTALKMDGPRIYYKYPDTLTPDIWFEPKAVWEVKAADLSISPAHRAAAGLVDPDKGISIRFPRLVRVRDDKGPEDSTSPEQVADMYRKQAIVQRAAPARGGGGGGEESD
jgi:DNA ligase 1